MQEISLEQLKKLLPGKLQESGNKVVDGVSFKDLCDEYRKIQTQSASIKHAHDAFVNKILSKYEPIKFVGDGTSRSAFACVGGKCIKVAKSQAGAAQNKQENRNTAKHWWRRSYSCFAKTYEHNDDYTLLLSECCSHIDSEQQLAEALGMDDESMLTAAIWAVAEEKGHDVKKSATSLRAKCTTWRKSGGSVNGVPLSGKNIDTAERAAEWLESLSDRRSLTPGKKSFLQIADFWKKRGIEELLPGDVGSCRNWGYAIRDGELTPVMLDVGFSQKVADVFYEDNHMNNENKLINYWAHMLDESSNIDITDVKIVPDDDYESEAEYNSSLPSFQQKHLVRQSEIGLDLANGIYKPEQIVNPELIPEAKHSMHGPAWARKTGGIDEIADMREMLTHGVVEFTFWKHGEEGQGEVQRRAVGTTSEHVIPISVRRELDPNYDENVASYERRSGFIIWFWDLEKDAACCFNTNRFDEIVNYFPTMARYNDEDRIGPIEVNKFVDDFDMP